MSRCLQRLYLMLFRQRILTQIGENPDDRWRIAQRVFSAAPAIYSGLIGPTALLTIQAEVMSMLCHDPQRAERCFFDNVTSADPIVAGYCIEGLDQLKSDQVLALPREVFGRTEVVVFQTGCARLEMSLGEFAAMTRDRVRK